MSLSSQPFIAAIFLSMLAQAANAGNWDQCQSPPASLAIKACTVLIQQAGLSHPKLANIYANRGIWYLTEAGPPPRDFERSSSYNADLDHAIADFTRAIELDSFVSRFYDLRCNSYERKRSFDLALRDCNRAIAIDPRNERAYSTGCLINY